jgi:glycerol-3-phosphate dehydrogenase (NAD(P)+)
MIAEGVSTCQAAYQLALKHNVSLPITSKMYEVLYQNKDPRLAIRELMDRPLTSE